MIRHLSHAGDALPDKYNQSIYYLAALYNGMIMILKILIIRTSYNLCGYYSG